MLLKRKENNKSKESRLLAIVGSFLFLIGVSIYSGNILYNRLSELEDTKKAEEFITIQKEEVVQEVDVSLEETEEETKTDTVYNYIGVLDIPKINFKRGFLSLNDSNNNVNKNIEVLEKSDMPDVENGNLIIAGHSGSGRVAYFKNLYKLELDDTINVYYNGIKYTYKVVNIYDVEKTGKVVIHRDTHTTALTLITCRHNTNKQIVIISSLVNKEDM